MSSAVITISDNDEEDKLIISVDFDPQVDVADPNEMAPLTHLAAIIAVEAVVMELGLGVPSFDPPESHPDIEAG